MKQFSWIKLSTDFFEDPKVLRLQSYPESEFLLIFWIKLVLMSLRRNDGLLMIDETIPYSIADFVSLFKKPENTVRMALSIFEKLNMIMIQNSDAGEIIGVSEFVGFTDVEALEDSRRGNRERQAAFRKRQKEAFAAIGNEKCLEKNSDSNALLTHDSLVINKESDVSHRKVTAQNRREENKNRVEEKREEKDFAPNDFSESEKSSKPEPDTPPHASCRPKALFNETEELQTTGTGREFTDLPPHRRIRMDPKTVRWTGILPDDIERWKETWPAVDVEQQLREMEVWASAHRSQWKSNWLRFIVHWLSKEQDKGGVLRPIGPRSGTTPKTFEEVRWEKNEQARKEFLRKHGIDADKEGESHGTLTI